MASFNALGYLSLYIAVFLTSPIMPTQFTTAFVVASPNALAPHLTPLRPTSALASKVIYESPSVDNIYKEFLVTSKPLILRKYGNGMKKTKKTKKDSKIYFIPIPPMPYRFIPGVGYDYQPMKINPIMQEPPTSVDHAASQVPMTSNGYTPFQAQQQTIKPIKPIAASVSNSQQQNGITDQAAVASSKDSKIMHMQHNDYYFNGRPFRLQVAHAHPKHHVTPQNLKSKFYFNKKIIY